MDKENRKDTLRLIAVFIAVIAMIAFQVIAGPSIGRWFCQTFENLCIFELK